MAWTREQYRDTATRLLVAYYTCPEGVELIGIDDYESAAEWAAKKAEELLIHLENDNKKRVNKWLHTGSLSKEEKKSHHSDVNGDG